MCDVTADKLSGAGMPHKKKNLYASLCMKCRLEKAVVVVRVHDPLCTSCFLTYVTHKFRSTLGKSKLVQANDNVLLAVSGGHSSTALLHLVKDALSEGAHKRLKFSPAVVCVDESETLPGSTKQDYSRIKELANQFGYLFYCIPMDQGFGKLSGNSDCESIASGGNQFKKCFESISSLTAQQDFLVARRASVIVSFARKNNYEKIMFGDTATSLCMKILCNISLGRGGTIPLDVGVSDSRYSAITIIRPMREFSSKEVAMFNRMREICVKQSINISTFKPSDSSLQKKTEEFVLGLQADFPHTVNTVFRTADKICAVEEVKECTGKCCLCESPLLCFSTMNEDKSCDQSETCCGSSQDCTSKHFLLTVEELSSQLCYACNLTFKEMHYNMNNLPPDILQYASAEIKRLKMKESIQDFLLE